MENREPVFKTSPSIAITLKQKVKRKIEGLLGLDKPKGKKLHSY